MTNEPDVEGETVNAMVAAVIAKRFEQLTGDRNGGVFVALACCEVLRLIDRDDFTLSSFDEFLSFEAAVQE